MQDSNEIEKINHFLTSVFPLVAGIVQIILQTLGCSVVQKGCGTDLVFLIKLNGKETGFFIYNLLLEIATVDRDAEPLIYDENLCEGEYFLVKMFGLIRSKVNILLKLMGQDDIDAAIEEIAKDADKYDRIRIVKFDTHNTSNT